MGSEMCIRDSAKSALKKSVHRYGTAPCHIILMSFPSQYHCSPVLSISCFSNFYVLDVAESASFHFSMGLIIHI